MDEAHVVRQPEQVSTCLGNDFEGAKVFFHKLLRGSSGSDVIRLKDLTVSKNYPNVLAILTICLILLEVNYLIFHKYSTKLLKVR